MTALSAVAEAMLGTTDIIGRTVDADSVTLPCDDFLYVDAAEGPVWLTVRLRQGQLLTVIKVDSGWWPVHLVLEHGGVFSAWLDDEEASDDEAILTLDEPGAAIGLIGRDGPDVYHHATYAP